MKRQSCWKIRQAYQELTPAVCASRHRAVDRAAAISKKGYQLICPWRHAVRARSFSTLINCRQREGRTLGDPRSDVAPVTRLTHPWKVMCAVIMLLAYREFPGRQLCKVLRLLCRQQSFSTGPTWFLTWFLLSRKLCKKASIFCRINIPSEFSFTHGSILVDLFQVFRLCSCLLQV